MTKKARFGKRGIALRAVLLCVAILLGTVSVGSLETLEGSDTILVEETYSG